MARPVTLFTGQWADLPLTELAQKTAAWGFDGLELACWGDHFEVDRALSDRRYLEEKRSLLEQRGLGCWALGAHLVGQAVCDPIDPRHEAVLPPEVWGDGEPEGVRRRAAERMQDTARAAAAFGVTQVNGFTGSPIWHMLYSFPPNDFDEIE
ncbi:MAG: sugar phosphate isomerase/epimerase, partial [Solirubrobacterales bacterium]|nr:sugar phosphate isomerase/epimerase [Solirubrobacterales bacterium]